MTSTNTNTTNLYFIGAQGVQGSFGYLGTTQFYSNSLNGFSGYLTGIQGVQASYHFIGCQTIQGQQGYLSSSLNTKDIFTTGIQGLQSFFTFSGVQTLQGQQGYLSSSLNTKDIFTVGIQGTQSSFQFSGVQTIQGQQGYLSSSLNTKDIFTSGIQGLQSSFTFSGVQTIQGQQGYLSSSLNTKDIYTVGIQGTQSSFRFSGVQTIQGQQGYFTSSLNTKDIFTTGIQGTQASFGYIGCQNLVLSANMFMTSNSARLSMTGSDPRIGIGVASPSYTLDIAGGVNLQSTLNVFRVAGIPVLGGDTDGAYVPQNLNVIGLGTFNNNLTVNSAIANGRILNQGAYLSWNTATGALGETSFVNKCGVGTGGFYFYNSSGSGSTFATGKNLLAYLTGNGYMFYNRPSIRVSRSGSWSVSSGENIMKGGSVNFERDYDGSGGYNSSNGIFTVPIAGVWQFSIYARWSDGAGSLAFKPATTSAFSIGNSDNSFWVPNDGGNRRTMMWSETLYMGSGVGYLCYAGNTGNMVEFIFSGHFVGL